MPQQNAILTAQAKTQGLLLEAGCTLGDIATWKLQLLASQEDSPQAKEIYNSAIPVIKKLKEYANETPITPTELGIMIGQLMPCDPLSARAVNKLLIEIGYQEVKERPSSKKGNPDKKFYAITEKGQEFGFVITDLINNNSKTVFHVRWIPSAAKELMEYLEQKQKENANRAA